MTWLSPELEIETVEMDGLQRHLGFREPLRYPAEWRDRPPAEWTMPSDDFVLRYIFRNFLPKRHLEIGTWEGDGVLRCVEESDATVWTLNLLAGEVRANGDWTYGSRDTDLLGVPGTSERRTTQDATWVHTDAYGMIGHKYLERDFGHRVCQIYCDSRMWDTRAYPDGFFDSVFLDGGHASDIVTADSKTVLRLVRRGGLMIWHDFCPLPEAQAYSEASRGVVAGIMAMKDELGSHCRSLSWINPSWILIGVRR